MVDDRREQGGSVEGYTAGTFAAYYIVWTLVRNMNIVFTPFGWEERIREGELAGQLVQPVHPIHYDLGSFAGWKVVVIVLWLPLAAALALAFDPALSPDRQQVAAFAVAIWGAYLIRIAAAVGASGWSRSGRLGCAALFEALVAELLLSGRLVPMALMPDWAQDLARFLPFQWTFGFPITALVGDHQRRARPRTRAPSCSGSWSASRRPCRLAPRSGASRRSADDGTARGPLAASSASAR